MWAVVTGMCSAAYFFFFFFFVAVLENVGESVIMDIMELVRWNVGCFFDERMTDEAEICAVLWGCVGRVFFEFWVF